MGLLRAGSLFRDFIPIIAGSIIINQSPPPFRVATTSPALWQQLRREEQKQELRHRKSWIWAMCCLCANTNPQPPDKNRVPENQRARCGQLVRQTNAEATEFRTGYKRHTLLQEHREGRRHRVGSPQKTSQKRV